MPEAARAPRSLDVDGRMMIETPGGPIAVEGRGARVRLSAATWRALFALGRMHPLSKRGPRQGVLRAIDRVLRLSDLTVDLAWRGRSLARMGPEVRGSLLARLFGWPDVQLVPLRRLEPDVVVRPSRRRR